MSLRRVAVLPVLGALVFAGCGSTATTGSSPSDFKDPTQKAVAQAVADFTSAAKKSDWGKVCDDHLTAQFAQALAQRAKGKCQDRIKSSLRDVSQFNLDIKKIAVTGTTAVATVETDRTGEPDSLDDLQLQKGTDGWRISGVAAPTTPTKK